MDDRRKKRRLQRRGAAKFKVGNEIEKGVILNFSEKGLFLQSNTLLPTGSSIQLTIGSKEDVHLNGKVVWCRNPSTILDAESSPGMGITLVEIPDRWLQFVNAVEKSESGRGNETRFDAVHPVRFGSGSEFLTEYTENLSRGGMYLTTSEPLKQGETLQIELEIPGVPDPLKLKGKVAYRLPPEEAIKQGRQAGVGIQFVDPEPEVKALLHQYVQRLGIHRSQARRIEPASLPLSGSLGEVLIPELLLAMASRSATGSLSLIRKGIEKKIFFKGGQPLYVASPLRSDSFIRYLVSRGKLKAEIVESLHDELSDRALQNGEVLLQKGLIDQITLADAFVTHQEEKLISTFSWFEGTYSFQDNADWTDVPALYPMQTYRVLFSGIERFYDVAVIHAWTGLDENTVLQIVQKPSDSLHLPLPVVRLLRKANPSRTLLQLNQEIKTSFSQTIADAFGLIIAGWAVTTAPETTTPQKTKTEEKIPEVPTREITTQLEREIQGDFDRLANLDFYQLLKLRPGVSDAEIERAFLEVAGRYSKNVLEQITNPAMEERARLILSWIRLAYDTLRDPALRQTYARRAARKQKEGKVQGSILEAERLLLTGIRELEKKNFSTAVDTFRKASDQHPIDSSLRGYWGWALFQVDSKENLKRATQLLDEAIEQETSDPNLFYFRGEVHGYMGNWRRAERYFEKAVGLNPRFSAAIAALDRARVKRIAEDRMSRGFPEKPLR